MTLCRLGLSAGGRLSSVAVAVSSSWAPPTAPGVNTGAADIAAPADLDTAIRLRAAGCRSAAAAGTVGDRIRAPVTAPARPETGPFRAACRHRRWAITDRRSGPRRHMPAANPLMPAA